MTTSLATLSATSASVCDRQSILTCCSPSPSTSISTAKSSVTESLTRGRIGSSCFDDSASRAAWTRASMLRSTVSLHGRGAIFGSADAGKCGPSRSAFGVLTARETALSGQEGSWVLIVHDCVFVWFGKQYHVGCVLLAVDASNRIGTGKECGQTLGTRYIITAVL